MREKLMQIQERFNNRLNEILIFCFENKVFAAVNYIVLLVIFAIGMYILNLHTPLLADDFGYSFSGVTGMKLAGIYDIYLSQYQHYFSWGGRSVVHFLAQLFLMVDKSVFNVFNTLAYVTLVLLIYFHAVGRFKLYPALLLLINISLFLFSPAFGQVFLWVIGSCNYLWGTLLVFLYLVPYRMQFNRKTPVFNNKLLCLFFFCGGIIAGWTNENMGLALIVMIAVYIYSYWDDNKKVYFWSVCGLAGATIGCILLIAAPGNFVRMETGGFSVHLLSNFFKRTELFLKSDFLLFPLCLFTALLVSCKKDTNYKIPAIYFCGMLISVYAMVASPAFPDRAKLGSLVFCLISCGNLYINLDFTSIKIKKLLAILMFAVVLGTGAIYKEARRDIRDYEARNNEKVAHTLAEKAKGNLNVVVKVNPNKTKYCAADGLDDISSDVSYWTNASFARYYGIKTVRVE